MPPRLWPAAGLLGLLAPAAGSANHNPAPCPPATCATPTRVVVECPPPEVTFKRAAPTCVRVPGAGGCAPGMQCFTVNIPQASPAFAPPMLMTAPQMMMAPVGMAAPQMMMAPLGMATPQMMAPVMMAPGAVSGPAAMMAPAPFAGPTPMMAPGFGAAPGCGGPAGLGTLAGLAGLTASDLRALADHQEGIEQMGLRLQAADLARRYNALAGHPAAAGLGLAPIPPATPKGAAPKGPAAPAAIPPAAPGAAAPAPNPPAVGAADALAEIVALREDILLMRAWLTHHQLVMEHRMELRRMPELAPHITAAPPAPQPSVIQPPAGGASPTVPLPTVIPQAAGGGR